MKLKKLAERGLDGLRIALTGVALFQFSIGTPVVNAQQEKETDHDHSSKTTSPIKHVIVIIGENRSFDHVFATYVPKNGQTVHNLLSEGIINADGTAGPHFNKAQQLSATDTAQDAFLLSPPNEEYPGNVLPTPLAGGPKGAQGYFTPTTTTPACPTLPKLTPAQCAAVTENGLPTSSLVPGEQYGNYASLASGGTGITSKTPDTRISDVTDLQAGPFQLSPGAPSNTYAASPVHRFYQMWQQENCSVEHATWDNPSGCDHKLFSWVEVTIGAGNNGAAQPPLCTPGQTTTCFSYNYLPNTPGQTTTGEGSTALGFYNVQKGDAPYFKSLADKYAMSDNFHQSVDGGTGANHIMFGHGDAIWFSDGNGNAAVPPENMEVFTEPYDGQPNPSAGVVNEIENPNPQAGTNNWWVQDGYGNAYNAGYPPPFTVSPASGGGSYSDCSDPKQPGVGPLVAYLKSLHIDPHCEAGHYYLLNNYNPGYFGQGENAYLDQNPSNTPFTIPPSSTPSIGDDLLAHHVSWKYYGDQWNNYAGNAKLNIPEDKYQLNYGTNGPLADEYCNICNPFQYDTSIMADAKIRTEHIQDTANLYDDICNGTLPAVSIVKPSGYVDGHPASSKLDAFEGFTSKIVNQVLASPYAKDTAIFITEDEGGGYYDSGYVQPLDFFGDGTRIIFLVVAPYLKAPGLISHEYADHVSILKFIERNWNLPPVSKRSRDNFPNPVASWSNPYVPQNSPAIGDLFDFFDFSQCDGWSGSH